MSSTSSIIDHVRRRTRLKSTTSGSGDGFRPRAGKFVMKLANNGKWLWRSLATTFVVAIVLFYVAEPTTFLGAVHWAIVNAFTQGTQTASTPAGLLLEDFYVPITWLFLLLVGTYVLARVVISLNEYTDEEQQDDCEADQIAHEEDARKEASLLRIEKALKTLPKEATELPLPDDYIPLYFRGADGNLVRNDDNIPMNLLP